jgi:adenine-specific DNA-methyltransferase
VVELEDELSLSHAFAETSAAVSHDTVLQWQGRNRFLAEKITPVSLQPVAARSLNPEKSNHKIIDGDNLAVMTSLLTDYRGKIDVIYIDPPYNTAGDVFTYNDNYRFTNAEVKEQRRKLGRAETIVSLDDPTRHTKWINHIAPRLWAARKLLRPTGVIIVSIDEHELPRLWLLMEEMFGEKNRLATLIWERSRKNDSNYISEGHEYMLLWARNKDELDAKRGRVAAEGRWVDPKGRWRKAKDGADAILAAHGEAKAEYGDDVASIQKALDRFFADLPAGHPAKAIRFKKVDKRGVLNDDGNLSWPGGGGPRYDVIHPRTKQPCTVPSRGWAYTQEEMQKLIDDDRINFKDSHTKIPRLITYLHEQDYEVQTSVIERTGQRSVSVVNSILGKGVFKNPKDHEMLAELFNLATWRDPKAIFLDPYAGSGTSGHAVLSMNAEDGGKREFILIESGDPKEDAKIPRSQYTNKLTAERVRRVITGTWADGKEHPQQDTGFHYFRARDEITKKALMASTRESLADVILQVVEDDSNRIDCRVEGHSYLIGKTRTGYGIGLVWGATRSSGQQILTWEVLEALLDEAESAGVALPVHVYATANTAPVSDDLYKFHQIPNSILARLGILDVEEEGE